MSSVFHIVQEGNGFGLGGFGGVEEPFGSVGFSPSASIDPAPVPGAIFPAPRRGAVILGGSSLGGELHVAVSINTAPLQVEHASSIDSSGPVLKSKRTLILG